MPPNQTCNNQMNISFTIQKLTYINTNKLKCSFALSTLTSSRSVTLADETHVNSGIEHVTPLILLHIAAAIKTV